MIEGYSTPKKDRKKVINRVLRHPFSPVTKAELGFVRTNLHIQWNPFYKAFHRIRACGNQRFLGGKSNYKTKQGTSRNQVQVNKGVIRN